MGGIDPIKKIVGLLESFTYTKPLNKSVVVQK